MGTAAHGARDEAAATDSFRTCNVHVEPMDRGTAVKCIIDAAIGGAGTAVHLCNAYTLSLAAGDASFAQVIDRGDYNLTDGMPVVWLGRHLGFDVALSDRPRGCDVFVDTVVAGQTHALRHYLYGATPDVVRLLATRLRVLAPDAQIVGVESPPFRALEAAEKVDLIGRVLASRAQIVWVGLGTPKQDEFVDEFRDELGATLVAVGAAFDFIAGAKREAPAWIARSGFEWAYRLVREPRRLWRRYLIGNARFVLGVLRTRARVS